MLTETQIRDLLHRAADTVDVSPGMVVVGRPAKRWTLLASAASVALVAGGVVVGQQFVHHRDAQSDSHAATTRSSDPSEKCDRSVSDKDLPTPPQGPDFPTNASGLTYGSSQSGKDPDLIAVIGDCGHGGYMYSRDMLDPAPWDPQAGAPPGSTRTVPIYESDGKTQIDTFTFGGGEGREIGGAQPATQTGPSAEALQGDWSVQIAGITNHGVSQFDTYADVPLSAVIRGNELRTFDGCDSWEAEFQLADGKFSLTTPFTLETGGVGTCQSRQAPLTQIFENIRQVSKQSDRIFMSLGNGQAVLVLRSHENGRQ
jgi:hypothetical protein